MENLITNIGMEHLTSVNDLPGFSASSLIVGQGEIDWVSITIWTTVILTLLSVLIPFLIAGFFVAMISYYIAFFTFAWLPFILFYLTVITGGIAFLWVYLD